MEQKSKDPLHGKRLDAILEELVDYYEGFEELGKQINIKCFTDNPSIKSSLKFLRKTDWARTKVESLYLYVLRQKKKQERLKE
ncbi:MAG: VF530 family protein [Flavobacteriales bacterium]|nr:VF530 family protein [Flavobacteriales bacterium]